MRKRNRGKYRFKLHLLSVEHILICALAENIRREIDREIINSVTRLAARLRGKEVDAEAGPD